MAALKTLFQGDSLSIGFTFGAYDTTRIEHSYVYLNEVEFTTTLDAGVLRCAIPSSSTKQFCGNVPVLLVIDDSVFGVRKTSIGNIYFQSTGTFSDSSVNTGYNIEVAVTIEEDSTAISVTLLEAFRGYSSYDIYVKYTTDVPVLTEEEWNIAYNDLVSYEQSALASKNAAKISEDNSKSSETAAEGFKNTASTKATEAYDSAGAASISEQHSKTSEDNAKASELAAEGFKNTANNQAEIATNKAIEANTSATNAHNSELAAKTSEDNAKDSEIASSGFADEAEGYKDTVLANTTLLGGIAYNAAAPTPAKSGYYDFISAGTKPAWLTGSVTDVAIGDRVIVVYANSAYTYTYQANPNTNIVQELGTGTNVVVSQNVSTTNYAKSVEMIAHDAVAPSPVIPTGTTKTYEFSSGGVCTWLAGGSASVKKGDKVTVAFTAPSTYVRTYQNVINRIDEQLSENNSDFIREHYLYADTGVKTANSAYDAVRIVNIRTGDKIIYTGGVGSGYHAIIAFNELDEVIDTDVTNETKYEYEYTVPSGVDYIICQARNSNWGVTPIMVVEKRIKIQELSNESYKNTSLLIPPLTISNPTTHYAVYSDTGAYITTNSVDATNLLHVSLGSIINYSGQNGASYHGLLAYNSNYEVIDTRYINGTFSDEQYIVNDIDIKYVRLQGRNTNYLPDVPTMVVTIINSVGIMQEKLPSIFISKIDKNTFDVRILQNTRDKYITHRFLRQEYTRLVRYYGETEATHSQLCSDCWYPSSIYDGEDYIMQGNANFIHMIDRTNEDVYVGEGHGCAISAYTKFFADGVEFDPTTLTYIECETFRFIEKNNIYAVDKTQPNATTDSTIPYFDASGNKILSTIHFLDATYSVGNKINYRHRLTVARDSTQFKYCFGAMFEIENDFFDKVIINNSEGSCNSLSFDVDTQTWTATPEYDSLVTFTQAGNYRGDEIVAFGGNYIAKQRMLQFDNSRRKKSTMEMRFYTGSNYRLKIYQQPIGTTMTNYHLGDAIETFNAGDELEVFVEREIDIN